MQKMRHRSTKRSVYEDIMKDFRKIVRRHLNEINIMGVEVDSAIQGKMSDLDDIDKDVPFKDRKITETVQGIYKKMFLGKYAYFMKQNKMQDTIEWSYKMNSACTDGFEGRLVMNPEFATFIYENTGDLGIQFIILHETMHNYYNNVRHAQKVDSVAANISVDRRINGEIISRWPEFKEIPEKIGALL